jgi:hypothetical protein
MSELKHTVGPWKFGVLSDDGRIIEKPFDYEGPGYYENPFVYGADGHQVVGNGEYCVFYGAGNARLITTAPELLSAVREQHDIIDTLLAMLITADPAFRPTKSALWPRIEAINAPQLIAKATGAA